MHNVTSYLATVYTTLLDMKNLVLILLLIVVNVSLLRGQIQGFVYDKSTELPLAYVNIGILGKTAGIISDKDGSYQLEVTEDIMNDTIIFSIIGFYPTKMKVMDLINNNNVFLLKKTYELEEIVVTPSKTKEKILGNNRKGMIATSGRTDSKGIEVGTILNVKNKAFLKTLILNMPIRDQYLRKEKSDSIIYRLNIYKVIDDENFENEQTSPIYIKCVKRGEKIEIDLSSYNLIVKGKTLISIEFIEDGYQDIYFRGNFIGEKSYVRTANHVKWEKLSIALSMAVKADIF